MKSRKTFPILVFGMFIWFFLAHIAFFTGPAYAVSYLVQSSETQLSAAQTTKTVPLGTPVDKSQSFFLLFPSNNQNAGEHPSTFLVNGRLSADGSEIVFERNASGPVANVSYSVVQHPGITVQENTYSLAAAALTADIPISAVDTSKSFVILHRQSGATQANHYHTQITGYLTSATNLRVQREASGTACTFTWQVVTFTDATTVQTNERIFGDTETLAEVTLGTSVDLSRSWVYFTVRSSGESGMAYTMVRGRIKDTSTLQFQRWNAVAGVIPKVRWFVVEFPSGLGANVQRGLVNTVATTDTILNATISAVDTSKTFLYHTSRGSGTGTAYPRHYWINRFSTTTNAQFQRWYSGKNGGIMWCAVRMHACPPSPETPSTPSPADGATGVSADADLDWADSTNTDSYDVYFGTSPTPPLDGNTTTSSYTLPTLDCGTLYYWKIEAKNICDTTAGAVWSFTTESIPVPGTPSTPNPADGATGVLVDADLDWADSSDADSYDVYFGTSPTPPYYGNTSTSSYTLPTLAYCTQYFWKIVAKNGCDTTEGVVWDFTTETLPSPGTPSSPSPAEGATGISIDADLDWADCSDATSYDVYFGTSPTPPYYGNTASSNYTLPTHGYETQYYWKVIAKNNCDITEGPVWDFTTEPCPTPGTPSSPNPADGATGVSVDADLDWADCSDADSYDVYGGTSPTPGYLGNTTTSSWPLGTLLYETTYYWKIIAKNDCGNSTEGPVWDFMTEPCPIPGTPGTPSPADGATNVSASAILDWTDCSDTDTYEVYLDTNPTPTTKVGESSSSSYDPDLNWDTHYYWKIIAKNDCSNSTEGPVWDFTTGPDPGGDHLVWPSSPTPLSPYSDWDTAAHTIADALAAAQANPKLGNKVVMVRAGTSYSEKVWMKDEVDLVAEEGVKPTITASPGMSNGVVEFTGPMTCNLTGFTIIYTSMGQGIAVDGSSGQVNATIDSCTVRNGNNFGVAIKLKGTVNTTITGCDIYNNPGLMRVGIGGSGWGSGDRIASGSSITIKGTTIGGSGQGLSTDGIRLRGATSASNIQVTIGGSNVGDGNTISYNGRAGILLADIDQFSIENNDISYNGSYGAAGVLIVDSSTAIPHIRNNSIHHHVNAAGINIGGASNVTIGDNNDIYANKTGISFYVKNNDPLYGGQMDPITKSVSSQPVTITGNNIYSNSYAGIAVRDGVTGAVTITQNNIYSNTRGGIRMQRKCTLNISRNTIRDNLRGGIHTGDDSVDGGGFAAAQIGQGLLTIDKNKIYDNGQGNMGGGIDVRHMPGTIYNNLVYGNRRGGIRFGDFITEIVNNTVVNNGWTGSGGGGGGIIYDDLAGAVNDPPNGMLTGLPLIRNNISVYSKKAGLRVGGNGYDCPENPVYDAYGNYRDYNLLYANYPLNDIFNRDNAPDCGWPDLDDMSCIKQQYGGCGPYFVKGVGILLDAPNDIIANPLFKDMPGDDYRLQRVSEGDIDDSPAINAGDDEYDMGAYGGSDPIDW